MLGFILGMVIGGSCGVIIAAVLVASRDMENDDTNKNNKTLSE